MKLLYVLHGHRYRNRKRMTTYQVFAVGNHSETAQSLVVYVSAKPRAFKHRLGLLFLRWASRLIDERVWIRPLDLFEEKFIGPIE